ncbi:MAG: hypothetical protein PHC34_08395 [Candidatus Gastranaerophilales bacterium]|nr:hypothetical protein [Candidatus Gastranaerophilales bacterium]
MNNGADRDLWHRLAVGQTFWQTGTILKHDIFAYTPVKYLWVDHEWGSGVIFYSIARLAGDYGLIFLKIFLLLTVILTIYAINKPKSNKNDSFKIGFYTFSIFAILVGFQSTVRSQVFTYLFFTLWIYLLEKIRTKNFSSPSNEKTSLKQTLKYIWFFPVTMLLWANLHGGFIAGFGLLGIYAIGEYLNKKNPIIYLAIIAISLPVTLINPYGLKFWDYMITAITMPRPYITEWKPLNLFAPLIEFIAFKLLLLITLLGWGYKILSKNKFKIDWTGAILLAVTLYLSIRHQRHVVFFAISASIFSYQYFYEFIDAICKKYTDKLLNFFSLKNQKLILFTTKSLVFINIIALGIYMGIKNPLIVKVNDAEYPTKAVEFIKINNLKGNLLLSFNWGSYALWKLHPQCKVSIDGRYEETYPDHVYKEVTDFIFLNKDWNSVLKKYHNDIVLLPTDKDIYTEFKKLKNWKMIYKDKYSAIFIPASVKSEKWKMPDKNINYSKTKFCTYSAKFT